MGRLTFDITDQQHQSIKAMAALQGKTNKEYAIERLFSSAFDPEQVLGEVRVRLEQRIAEGMRGEAQRRAYIAALEKSAEALAKEDGNFKGMSEAMPDIRMAPSGKHCIFASPSG